MHCVAPATLKWPEEQSAQLDKAEPPVATEKVPEMQFVQLVLPEYAWYIPIAHAVQLGEPTIEYKPGLHSLHDGKPDAE